MEGVFLPKMGEAVRDILKLIEVFPHDFGNPLERRYLPFSLKRKTFAAQRHIRILQSEIHNGQKRCACARTCRRRLRVMTPLPQKDFRGELWVAVTPKSFPIKLAKGVPLSQLRLFNKDTRLTEEECKDAFETHGLLMESGWRKYSYEEITIRDNDGSIILTLDLSQDIAGYECRGSNKVLDFSKGTQSHDPTDF